MRAAWPVVVALLCACNTPMKPRVGGKPGEYETPESLRPAVERAVALGRELFEYDLVSARATDVLHDDAKVDFRAERLAGWITFKQGDHHVVQFVKQRPDGTPGAAYEIPFQPGAAKEEGLQQYDPPAPLDPEIAAMFRTRTVALRQLRHLCGTGWNPVVLPASRIGKEGWLVYVLAGTSNPNQIVLAGHQLFRVSADGNRLEEELPLSKSCLIQTRDQAKGELVAMAVSNPLGPTPHEGHVFNSLLYRMSLYVMGENKLWRVEGKDIVFLGVQ